jgi:hypothetical protein
MFKFFHDTVQTKKTGKKAYLDLQPESFSTGKKTS